MEIKYLETNKGILVNGPALLKPQIFKDERGFFFESWNKKKLNALLKTQINFDQDNHSYSFKGVLRGLHYQLSPYLQGKLVRCIKGEIFDVAVDIQKGSETYGEWVGCYLSSKNRSQLWIPNGFAHGFLTLSESADVVYKASGYWNKNCERSIIWNDKKINIDWPLSKLDNNLPTLTEKDNFAPSLQEAEAIGEIL